jgi:hypothetical protein
VSVLGCENTFEKTGTKDSGKREYVGLVDKFCWNRRQGGEWTQKILKGFENYCTTNSNIFFSSTEPWVTHIKNLLSDWEIRVSNETLNLKIIFSFLFSETYYRKS